MRETEKKGLLKISELAEQSGTSLTTVKYYVKEGLVDIAMKTGKNMAWYSPESVERIKLIKTLQSEKYYPLTVIKRMVCGGAESDEAELLNVISKADEENYYETMPLSQAVRDSGLRPREAEALIAAGLVTPGKKGRTRLCTNGEKRLMGLVKKRRDVGIPVEQSIKAFTIYEERLRDGARRDIISLVSDCMLRKNITTEEIVDIINVSDQSLDEFISMRRYALNAAMGDEFLRSAELALDSLSDYAAALRTLFEQEGENGGAALLGRVIDGVRTGDRAADSFAKLLRHRGKGVAQTLNELNRAYTIFEKPTSKRADEGETIALAALRLGILHLAPSQLFLHDGADITPSECFGEYSDRRIVSSVLELVKRGENVENKKEAKA